jgi:hypothetical protein
MAVSVRGLLAPPDAASRRLPRVPALLLAAGFALAAAASSLLALGNAPVGPTDYTPGVRDLSDRFAGKPTLLLAPADVIADQHGREFYSWEIREADPGCVEALGYDGPTDAIRVAITLSGDEPPFAGARAIGSSEGVTAWRLPASPGTVTGAGSGVCSFDQG